MSKKITHAVEKITLLLYINFEKTINWLIKENKNENTVNNIVSSDYSFDNFFVYKKKQ
jgi:hypothetical protein